LKREKQITGWLKDKKIKLIENFNPKWVDLIDRYQLFDKNIKYDISY
jgi:predicted GIY-YIG superfamily endonuclease